METRQEFINRNIMEAIFMIIYIVATIPFYLYYLSKVETVISNYILQLIIVAIGSLLWAVTMGIASILTVKFFNKSHGRNQNKKDNKYWREHYAKKKRELGL